MSSSPSLPPGSPLSTAGADRSGDAAPGESEGLLPDVPLPALVYGVESLRYFGLDVVEKASELLRPMTPMRGRDHLAGSGVECREE